jgi:hypothetical protein
MDEKDFLEKYLWPSGDRLNRTFTHPLPNIEGLKNCGDFIVQCEHEDTFSTNIITKYVSDVSGVILKEVYKNTQNKITGVFVRLVGTMSLVKVGYPRLSLDAPISNVNLFTERREDVSTKTFICLPQADSEQGEIFVRRLNEQAQATGVTLQERKFDFLPDYWGTIMVAESKGANLDLIRQLRDFAWGAYKCVIEETKGRPSFSYKPIQENAIFKSSGREHLMFGKMGLSVPVEVQAAFFSVLVSGI